MPIEASDFDVSSQGTLPTPKLILANVSGLFSSLAAELDNLIGCKVIRKRTFGRFLDEVNFLMEIEADPTQHLPDQIWFIDRKVNESRVSIEWELASAFDFQGVQLPFGQVTRMHVAGSTVRQTAVGQAVISQRMTSRQMTRILMPAGNGLALVLADLVKMPFFHTAHSQGCSAYDRHTPT